MLFENRPDAGKRLAGQMLHLKSRHPVVLALPRGGVPVGFEIASTLEAPLDLVLVRKIGAPGMPELAVGAIVDGEILDKVIDERMVAELGVSRTYLEAEIARQKQEIERRRQLYLRGRPSPDLRHCTALVVDDGLATGATMRAALRAVRRRSPEHLVMAVPVAPARTMEELRVEVDDIICLATPEDFMAIGQFYADFHQVSDEEVIALLDQNARLVSRWHH